MLREDRVTKYARESLHREPSIQHLKAWGVPRVAETSGANAIIKEVRQYYRDFFCKRAFQANKTSSRSARSSDGVRESSQTHRPQAHSTVAAQEIPQPSTSGDLSSLERKRPSPRVDEDITADGILPEDRESQSRQKRAKTDQTQIIAQPNIHGWESQVSPVNVASLSSNVRLEPASKSSFDDTIRASTTD